HRVRAAGYVARGFLVSQFRRALERTPQADRAAVENEPSARGAVSRVVSRLPSGHLAAVGKRPAGGGCGGRAAVTDTVVGPNARAAAGVCCRRGVDGPEVGAVFFD